MVRRAKSEKKQKKTSLPPIHCKGCTVNFVPKDRRQHFHSETCREDYYQRTYYSKTTTRKICPNCDTKFPTTKPGRQVYCSPECREEARNKRRDGIAASLTAERKTFLGNRFAAMEKDGFKCVYCGKSSRDGVRLDVEDNGKGSLQTVCSTCKEGREFNNDAIHKPNS